jgi:putative OPT family oligopeptide transporter
MAAPQQPPIPVKRRPDEAPSSGQLTGHKPYVSDEARIPEFTWTAVLLGAVLGIIFGASSLYLVLKVGLTVSASIPVAVMSITLFRLFSRLFGLRPATILENNIVQTTGSAGESIAFGVGVTMPALMLLGFEMDVGRVMVISVLGGMLGILMMIPLRRAFIVKQHGKLRYPEGTACADVLIVGEQGGSSATTVFVGFGIAALYQFLYSGMKLWKEVPARALSWFKGAVPAIEVNPALLGVGYIIGTKISCIMVAGGVLSAFVLIPGIRLFGDGLLQPLYPGKAPISQMNEYEIWKNYVLYIGAGAVAAGGIISLFQALPLIFGSMRAAFGDIRSGERGARSRRTDRDMPPWLVLVGGALLVVAIWATTPLHKILPWIPQLEMSIWAAVLIVLFGFLFVTVSSRLTGEIGSSSNPISGMTVATLLLTCTIFLLLGKDHPEDRLAALSVAAVVCIAASNGGTTSQDLKTGYLVGATPKWQQWAILVGSVSSALAIGAILIALNKAETIYSNKDLPQPRVPINVSSLPDIAQAPGDNAAYHVWRAPEGNPQDVPQGEYLVDDSGRIRYLVDPGINGKLPRRNGVTFTSPKARLMAFITDGILNRNLPWELVLLGVAIAIVLELCGVPSLPFAVGVYLPLASSTPIFAGGLVRWVADWRARRAAGSRPVSETEADMSPGVLLSTGYIAGGAIAGVLIAFLSFSETIPAFLARWQYRTVTVTQQKPFDQIYRDIAHQELTSSAEPLTVAQQRDLASLNSIIMRELARSSGSPNTYKPDPDQLASQMGRLADDERTLLELTRVNLSDTSAKAQLFSSARTLAEAAEIAALNTDLQPAGAAAVDVKLPQKNWPALVAFGLLTLLLAIVGAGRLMRAAA